MGFEDEVERFTDDQIGYNGHSHARPVSHAPARPIPVRLSSHPVGNITGVPGCNATQVVLAELGINADWVPQLLGEQLARIT